MQLFEAILHQGLVPDVITNSTLISACEKGSKPQHAPQMLHRGLLRNVLTYNAATSEGE